MRNALLMGLLICGTAVFALDEEKRETTAKDDEQFVAKASASGQAEVQMGTMAARQATSPAVKKFAQQMVEDHTKANKELATLAEKLKFRTTEKLEPRYEEKSAELKKLSGEAFDRGYIAYQVKAHEEAVALFQKQAEKGASNELRAWAKKTLPTLQMHLKMARELSGREGGTTDRTDKDTKDRRDKDTKDKDTKDKDTKDRRDKDTKDKDTKDRGDKDRSDKDKGTKDR